MEVCAVNESLNQKFCVIDNFYRNPNELREWALQLQFVREEEALYLGANATHDRSFDATVRRLYELIPETVDAPCNPKQAGFNLSIFADEALRKTRIHADKNKWAAIVYLSDDPTEQGGTGFYCDRVTANSTESQYWIESRFGGLKDKPHREIRNAMLAYSRDLSNWERTDYIQCKYNRCIIFRSDHFHAAGLPFGKNKKTGRLIQTFEFYAD